LKPLVERFLPLLIESDPVASSRLEQACRKTSIPFPLPVFRDGSSARKYLSGEDRYADRKRFPQANLVLMDQGVPGGLEAMGWIRSRSEFSTLPVFYLAAQAEGFDLALAEGADYLYVKPPTVDQLKDTVRSIVIRWAMIVQAQRPL